MSDAFPPIEPRPDLGLGIEPVELTETTTVGKNGGGRGLRMGAIAIAVLAFVGAVGFGLTRLLAPADGPQSGEEAVRDFLDALDAGDLVGLVETIRPAERETLGQPMLDVLAEMQRMEVLDPDADLASIQGIDFDFSGVELGEVAVHDDLSWVALLGGETTASIDPATVPLGDLVLDRISRDELGEFQSETSSIEAGPTTGIAAVEEDGRWYVSLWFSVAEIIRRDGNHPMPTPDAAVAALGTGTPEALGNALIEAAVDLDLRALMGHLDPDEAAALHRYAPLFLPQAEEAIADVRNEVTWDVTYSGLSWEADVDGDRGFITPVIDDDLTVTLTLTDVASGETIRVGYADDCVTIEPDELADAYARDLGFDITGDGRLCIDDAEALQDQQNEMTSDLGLGFLTDNPAFAGEAGTGGGLAVVQRDGRWFLSPTLTVMTPMVEWMQGIERADIDEAIDGIVDLADGFGLGGGGFTPGPLTPGGADPYPEPDPAVAAELEALAARLPATLGGLPLADTSIEGAFGSISATYADDGYGETVNVRIEVANEFTAGWLDGLPGAGLDGRTVRGFVETGSYDVYLASDDLVVNVWSFSPAQRSQAGEVVDALAAAFGVSLGASA